MTGRFGCITPHGDLKRFTTESVKSQLNDATLSLVRLLVDMLIDSWLDFLILVRRDESDSSLQLHSAWPPFLAMLVRLCRIS